MRSMEWKQLIGKILHGDNYLWSVSDQDVVSLQRTKVCVFSDSVLCLGEIHENHQSNTAWERRLEWFKSTSDYRNLDRIYGEPMEFEWNIIPGFNTLQFSQEVKCLLLRSGETPENFTGKNFLHVDVQRHLMVIKRQQHRMRVKCLTRFSNWKKIWSRTMVTSRSRFREKVVFYQ